MWDPSTKPLTGFVKELPTSNEHLNKLEFFSLESLSKPAITANIMAEGEPI